MVERWKTPPLWHVGAGTPDEPQSAIVSLSTQF